MTYGPKLLLLTNTSVFSIGVRYILENASLEMLEIVSQWENLFDYLQTNTPHVILINLLPSNGDCIGWLEKLRHEYPQIPLIIIIKEGCIEFFKQFIILGITGFLFSDITPMELIRSINRVSKGKEYFPIGIFNMVKESLEYNSAHLHIFKAEQMLTPREAIICKLFCNGLSYKQIGAELFISPRTVETHKRNILSKLKIKSTADMVKYAIQHKMI